MKNKTKFYALNLILLMILFWTFISTAKGQSTSQANPTPITTNEITAKGPSKETDYYYRFTGGPGEVTITLNIKAKQYSTFARLEVLDAELNTLATHNMNAATSTGPSQVMKKITLAAKQPVLLKLTFDGNLAEYKVMLGGAVEFNNPSSNVSTSAGSSNQVQQDSGSKLSANKGKVSGIDSGKMKLGQVVNVPKSGTLVIHLNDGSKQEVDLKKVKSITVKP